MSVNEFSVLELLRATAVKLDSSQDLGLHSINGLCERDLATYIYQHYQVNGESQKRKFEDDIDNADQKNMKDIDNTGQENLKVNQKVPVEFCLFDNLPAEVVKMILKFTNSTGKKSLRQTCRRLYKIISAMDSMFDEWCVDASSKQPLPDFVLNSDKKMYVLVKKTPLDRKESINNFLMTYSQRISGVSLGELCHGEYEDGIILSFQKPLEFIRPVEFPNLISLELMCGSFDSQTFAKLAPQLEYLTLNGVSLSPNDFSENFTNIKYLCFKDSYYSISNILMKCGSSLEHLQFEYLYNHISDFMGLTDQLKSLKRLEIELHGELEFGEYVQQIRTLLSKVSGTLTNLSINFHTDVDFSRLLLNKMVINTLKLEVRSSEIYTNIANFLNDCPLIQKLVLCNYEKEIEKLELRNLTDLTLSGCNYICMLSVLKQMSTLRTLNIEREETNREGCDCVCPLGQFPDWDSGLNVHLDTVWSSDTLHLDKIAKNMLPPNTQVYQEDLLNGKVVMRRVYNIHDY